MGIAPPSGTLSAWASSKDGRQGGRIFLPAAGNRNGTSLNNAGSNGNYWGATPNSSNADNAYNLNFNSSDHNVNNNNRYNGYTVRPVTALALPLRLPPLRQFFFNMP